MLVKELVAKLLTVNQDLPVYIGEYCEWNYGQTVNPAAKVTPGKYYEGRMASLEPTEDELEDEMLMEELNGMPIAVFILP